MTTIKTEIIRYLEANGPKFGGQIEDYIRQTGAKSSNTSRRCRELVNSGILERELVKVEGVPNRVVRYRIQENPLIEADLVINPPEISTDSVVQSLKI